MHRSWFSRLFGGSTRDEAFAPVPATEVRKAEAGGFDSAESLRACLDCLPGNVFFADPAFRLTYMNDAARRTVQAVEPEIRRVFGVSAADILNGSIHRFHRDPARVEAILQNYVQTLPREAIFSFGNITLRTAINAVLTPERRLLGYIVNWEDVSRLRSMEAEVEQRRERARQSAEDLLQRLNELRTSVQEISHSAAQVVEVSNTGQATADAASESIRKLGTQSQEIGSVLKLIDTIAAQTRLLALNATIEAARAGDAGKGFAVVANEVKELAAATAGATEEISAKIGAIRSGVTEAVEAIERIQSIMREVHRLQMTVAAAVEEQSVVVGELGRGASEVL